MKKRHEKTKYMALRSAWFINGIHMVSKYKLIFNNEIGRFQIIKHEQSKAGDNNYCKSQYGL